MVIAPTFSVSVYCLLPGPLFRPLRIIYATYVFDTKKPHSLKRIIL
jgi:hypothetical protein